MRKPFFLILAIFTVILGICFGVLWLNKNYALFWNANHLSVTVQAPLQEEKVKIYYSSEGMGETGPELIYANGKQVGKIPNWYGANKFRIQYGDSFFVDTGHFKKNDHHQHQYEFRIFQDQRHLALETEISGRDGAINRAHFREVYLTSGMGLTITHNPPLPPLKNLDFLGLKNQDYLQEYRIFFENSMNGRELILIVRKVADSLPELRFIGCSFSPRANADEPYVDSVFFDLSTTIEPEVWHEISREVVGQMNSTPTALNQEKDNGLTITMEGFCDGYSACASIFNSKSRFWREFVISPENIPFRHVAEKHLKKAAEIFNQDRNQIH